jgi:hypothetical protein
MSTTTPRLQLGFHLDGRVCRVGCSFCYLGLRIGPRPADGRSAGAVAAPTERTLDPELLAAIVAESPAADIAVAISEPARRWRRGLEALAAAARARGVALSVTTTAAVIAADPWVLDAPQRVSLSLDPEKDERATPSEPGSRATTGGDSVEPSGLWTVTLRHALAHCVEVKRRRPLEVVGLVTLSSPAFAESLASGLLGELLDGDGFDAIALNGLKPPPAWSDRAFWLRFCRRIQPLLARHLNRKLHLDCYVGARFLGLGPCPAKPDVSPGREFRACVYQPAPDFVFADATELARLMATYEAPEACPFPLR